MGSVDPFKAPVVSSLSVRVVVDSVFDQFMPKATHPMCTIEHIGRIRTNLNSTLAGEWGLSLHLESRAGSATGQYLLDFGYTPEILTRNFDLLGIEPERLNGLILSQGHRDHYGGLKGFVSHYRDRMRDDLRLFAGGKERFARNGLARATNSRLHGERLTARNSKPPMSRRFTVRPPMHSMAHSRLAISRASLSKGYCPTRWSSRPPLIILARMSGAAASSPTAIPMSMRRVMSCRDAAWW
jgi:hypothetical protein